MVINLTIRAKIRQIITYFETGSLSGYGSVSIYRDGVNDTWQITYGVLQTTQQGKLPKLLAQYVKAKADYSEKLAKFAPFTAHTLYANEEFLTTLRLAGNDPVMQEIQDAFFQKEYIDKAEKWADDNNFTLPLSLLVITDSFIHSGGILKVIRDKFPEYPPIKGGDEKKWVEAYCKERLEWLEKHKRVILRKTVYRPKCFLCEVENKNWDLVKPINANGRKIK